jgi:dienelactone hydrolase
MRFKLLVFAAALGVLSSSCNNSGEQTSEEKKDSLSSGNDSASIKEEAVEYNSNGSTLKGYAYYNESSTVKKPIVLVVPEWWGLTEYPRMRAKMLAEMGYFAMAVDMYGNGKTVDNPQDAQSSATPFYQNPQMGRERLVAALSKAKTYPQADSSRTAAIGYCFGGSMVLGSAVMGTPFAGVVSFHGGLEGIRAQQKPMAKILVCHGAADSFVPQAHVDAFKKSMDSVKADYTFKVYPDATHAFTNPDATKKGEQFKMPIKYNGAADTASWNDMKAFLSGLFR